MTRSELLRKLQAADFAAHDAALFLNTHPDNAEALACYHKLQTTAENLRSQYEAMFGPLTVSHVKNRNYWDWLKEPWPWEKGE